MNHYNLEIFFAGLLLSLSMPAEAHPGHGLVYDFQVGFQHPLFGIDHLLAMVGVGLWASCLGGPATLWLPFSFLLAMIAGASFAFTGSMLAAPEIWVATSVLAVGAMLLSIPANHVGWVRRASLPTFIFERAFRAPSPPYASSLAALFAFAHGYVHALEAGADSHKLYYLAGFLASTALLLGIGLTVGGLSVRRGRWIRIVFGAFSAGVGITLLFGI